MNRRPYTMLAVIAVLVALALWIDLSDTITIRNPIDDTVMFSRNVGAVLGLDLRGGLQVLLEADLPEGTTATAEQMEVAKTIFDNRTNALGVSDSALQVAGNNRIVAEFPGVDDPDQIMGTLGETGLLEFVDLTGVSPLPAPGTIINTDFGKEEKVITVDTSLPEAERVYHTVMTGTVLDTVTVVPAQLSGYEIAFTTTSEGAAQFKDFTGSHIGQPLAIVLDKRLISAPTIQAEIDTQGTITGNFTNEEANAFAIQLRYGSLPIPFKVVESRIVGPTLGQDSLNKSLIAGLIGMAIVFLFMGIYYRLPGVLADLSIIVYALIAFALFKWIPVTLTLAGVAGFLLSTGSALDANILIFERLKEELRAGKNLRSAVDLGWVRAWSSIRDSNIATLITSGILWWFGNTFGATIVKGFAFTLFIGVAISLFTALVVTRTFLNIVVDRTKPGAENLKWFGIY
jgi:preprotein translocase subunit SecD